MRVEPWLVAAGLAVVVPGVLFAQFARRHPASEGPPVLGQLAPFTLVRESGAALSSADLAGKVWVADFVFLGCTESCPLLTTRMSHLENVLQEEAKKRGAPLPVRLVTFTVDPANDTPERLSAYATRWHADPDVWTFATGSLADVQRVVADGFKIAFGKVDNGSGAFEMMHGNYFVVVDDQMKIRGYYSSDRPEEMSHLAEDLVLLATRPGADFQGSGVVVAKGGPS
jgi:protein SCO1/2